MSKGVWLLWVWEKAATLEEKLQPHSHPREHLLFLFIQLKPVMVILEWLPETTSFLRFLTAVKAKSCPLFCQ